MTAEEDAALMAEIAKLSGQIDQFKSKPRPPPQAPRGRGAWRGRGSWSGHASLAPASTAPYHPTRASRHRSLVFNSSDPSASTASNGAASGARPESSAQGAAAAHGSDAHIHPQGWVRRKTTHNMSLVSADAFEKTEPARIAAFQATQAAKEAAKTAPKPRAKPKASSASVRRGDNMGEVIIDGVVFAFDETGTKLVKKAQDPSNSDDHTAGPGSGSAPSSSTDPEAADHARVKAPLRTSVNGQAFIRTKRGNLISAEFLEQRRAQKANSIKLKKLSKMGQQIGDRERLRSTNRKLQGKVPNGTLAAAKGLCSFFTKTGQCKRGLSCPFKHDASKLAICPWALRPAGCSQPPGLCPLSHEIKVQRVPHCAHFLSSGNRSCRYGDDCLYTHPSLSSGLSSESPVCMDFAVYGWCDRGRDCTSRHTFDCPDFIQKGSCERKRCKLLHVVDVRGSGETPGTATSAAAQGEVAPETAAPNVVDTQELISSGKRSKRKRLLVDGDPDEGNDQDTSHDGLSFVPTKSRKNKQGAGQIGGDVSGGFTQQRDYIGFDDDDDDDDEGEDDEEGGEGGTRGEELSEGETDVESVSSDDDDDDDDDDDESSDSSDSEDE